MFTQDLQMASNSNTSPVSYADMAKKTGAVASVPIKPICLPTGSVTGSGGIKNFNLEPSQPIRIVTQQQKISGAIFANLDDLFRHFEQNNSSSSEMVTMINQFRAKQHQKPLSSNCALAIHYVRPRSRGTCDHIKRLVLANEIAGFDWNSTYRGEEHEELAKYQI